MEKKPDFMHDFESLGVNAYLYDHDCGRLELLWWDNSEFSISQALACLRSTNLWKKIHSTHKPQAKDLFIESLSRLCDDGDIDVLVRHLNWQHEDIAFLTSQLKSYESSLAKLDDLRVACARLRDQANRLRERNSALIKVLRESSIPLPKTPTQHEKSKKNKNSSR